MKHTYLKQLTFHRAFTMLELVMVIVVLGILASLAIPRLDRDLKQEAADTVLSHIRYTQHLALSDNKHKFNEPEWQKAFWKISFESCSGGGIFIGIGTDVDYEGDTDKIEAAIDPSNGKPMFWTNTASCVDGGDGTVSETIFLTKKYGITDVTATGGCNLKHIGFDYYGRPQISFAGSTKPDYSNSGGSTYMDTKCTFTFTMSDSDTFSIDILPETGYAYISGQDGS